LEAVLPSVTRNRRNFGRQITLVHCVCKHWKFRRISHHMPNVCLIYANIW